MRNQWANERTEALANIDAVYATAVVGPDQCRESAGRIAVDSGPEERSDVCVATASLALSTNDRPVISYPSETQVAQSTRRGVKSHLTSHVDRTIRSGTWLAGANSIVDHGSEYTWTSLIYIEPVPTPHECHPLLPDPEQGALWGVISSW